jgi:hypothetical protein
MENLLTNLKTKEKIAEKRKTTEETESKPSNPKLVKKTEPTRNILENICIRSLASRNICPLAKLGKCNSNLASTILKQQAKMVR